MKINTVEISGLSDITPAGTVITERQTFRYGSPGPIADSAPLEAPWREEVILYSGAVSPGQSSLPAPSIARHVGGGCEHPCATAAAP